MTYFWVDAIIGGRLQGTVTVDGVEDLTGYTVKLNDNEGNVESDGTFDFNIEDSLVLRLTKDAEVLVINPEGITIYTKESVRFKK